MPFLKEDIYSNFHHLLYGAAGTDVAIIADHENVQIVEDKDGNRFPVATAKLSDVALTSVPRPAAPPEPTTAGRGQKKKASVVTQSNLF